MARDPHGRRWGAGAGPETLTREQATGVGAARLGHRSLPYEAQSPAGPKAGATSRISWEPKRISASDRESTPSRSAHSRQPDASWRNPSIVSPAVTATGTTFRAAIVVRSLFVEKHSAAGSSTMRFAGSVTLSWQRRGPEGAFTTRSGPDCMFRFEAIGLTSGVRLRRNHLGRHHHHRPHVAWPRLR